MCVCNEKGVGGHIGTGEPVNIHIPTISMKFES